ncbi:MAG: leucine-rich repeat protein [Clostridia bacterium]|nr:leucine-rich repeat protein [Clostridia bacterium]
MKKSLKRILCGALSLLTVSSLVLERSLSGANAEHPETTATADVSFKNVTGQFDTSKLMESYLNTSVMKSEDVSPTYETRTVIVTLSGKNVVDSANGESVSSYLSTWAGQRTKAAIADEQDAFLRALSKKGISYTLEGRYNNVLNGVAIDVNTEYVSEIKKMSGVESVVITTAYAEPKTVATSTDGSAVTNETNVYATGIYDPGDYDEMYGEGTVVAVLDTGLDYTHPAFQRFQGDNVDVAWSREYVQSLLENNDLRSEERSGSLEISDVYVNAKVPFAYDYADDDADVYPSYSNHGTHVAGIIGGYDTSGYTDKDGNPISETFKGVVPDSQLVICKVFTDDLDDPDLGGAVAEDIIAALDDCVMLGVDVINMSLGTSCGFTTTDDGDSEGELLNAVYEDIKKAGISLVCAASNDYSAGYGGVYGTNLSSNPDSGTVGSPSTFAAALSVASVNGQKASYMIANEGDTEKVSYAFYEESRDIDGNPFDFVGDMKKLYNKSTFEYVVVPGTGQAADYDSKLRSLFKDSNGNSTGRIALIKRGESTFQEKVEIAMQMGAAGVIVYNNVAGVIRMNLGEIENPVPSVSINMNAGNAMVAGAKDRVGTIRLGEDLKAGPFMSEFSSWGPTHDLKLKPEITAHGGEITSTVPGGYGEQSGTSMASPNMAGFTALVRSYLIKNHSDLVTTNGATDPVKINRLATQLIMSTATTAYDQDGLAYSPRKQGAGLARMERVIDGTQAYLWTNVEENDYRPKLELGDDDEKTGVYTMSFNVTNFGSTELKFATDQIVMTETLSSDNLTVSEQAHMLDKAKTVWTVNGQTVSEVKVAAGADVTISVTITLDESEKKYIDDSFENGMYVEGFLKLNSKTSGQCDLSIPFLAFYGDWEAAPMLDYTAFEVAENEQDASVKEEDKIKASVWATLPYNSYYNEKYILPMGSYVYLLPDDADPVYVDEDKCSVSRYNIYYGEGEAENYLTSTSIKAVYAGLLRNARLVKYRLYSEDTGELILEDVCNRVGKAYAGGGQATPANVELELSPEAEGLMANGKYRMEFEFFMDTPEEGETAKEENTYEFTFTVDYDAPILEDARVRYYNYKDGNKEKQRIYLDVDVYDNHYAQAIMLCYPQMDAAGDLSFMLATDYPTPIRNAKPNGTTTVSIEITDIYEKYGSQLYVQIDDYAVNSCLYQIDINAANLGPISSVNTFEITTDDKLTETDGVYSLTLDQYESYKVDLSFEGDGDESNFVWSTNNNNVAVKNGEIVGLKAGKTVVAVSSGKNTPKYIEVTVTDLKNSSLVSVPSISFGIIKTNQDALAKATGTVKVNVGDEFVLPIETDPWYHPMTNLRVVWSSTDPSVAKVEGNGNVKTLKKGTTVILAAVERKNAKGEWEKTLYSTSVTLRVQNEFTVSNYTLTDYNGMGGEVVIPTDMNIWYIGAEAFKDNDNITKIVIPASVTQINERAFINCTALEEVYFVSEKHRVDENGKIIQYDENWNVLPAGQTGQVIDWADVSMIYEQAFYGCTNLRKIDFSNVKTVTVANQCFAGCPNLSEVVDMPSVGTMHHYAFAGTALKSVDLTGLHMSGDYVFANCKQLTSIEMGKFTAIGNYMFAGCTALREKVTIGTTRVGDGAFSGCVNLSAVEFKSPAGESLEFEIGARAFENCGSALSGTNFTVDFGGENIRVIGDRAFAGSSIKALTAFGGLEVFGSNVFAGTAISTVYIGDSVDIENMRFLGVPFEGMNLTLVSGSQKYTQENGILYNAAKTKVFYVNPSVTGNVTLPATVEEIGAYAFAYSNVDKAILSSAVKKIGVGAFEGSSLKAIDFNGAQLTKIPESAFRGTDIATVVLPESVTYLGSYAFADSAISNITANGLTAIGDGVFENCIALRGALVDQKYVLTLPETLKTMGDRTFSGCTNLAYVELPSLTKLGSYTFYGAEALKEATFGNGATTVGAYTFANTGVTQVLLGNTMTTIAEGAFYGCNSLTEINLPDTVTSIGMMAFQGCGNLKTVNGIENVKTFGVQSFYESGIETLNLTSATTIGDFAFGSQRRTMAYTSIDMPVVETIGDFAFFNGGETTVVIPATLKKIGYGAFANSRNLNSFTVEDNTGYIVENNVLYRVIDQAAGEYEVTAYPAALSLENKTLTVKTGTLRIDSYAFYGLNKDVLDKVTLPYTVNAIGDSAFYASGVKEYTFESIQAPTLETVYRQEISDSIQSVISKLNGAAYYKGYYNTNFEKEIYYYTKYVREENKLIINYPTNGNGYTNHVYKLYFGVRNAVGTLPEDETRMCTQIIDALPEASEVQGWTAWDKTDDNKAKVEALSETVKTARLYFNNANSKAEQKAFITAEQENKLLAVEKALRSVKEYFGIAINLVELRVAESSTHKTEYVAGETFDMTGLVVELVYDDYSTEIAKGSQLKLDTTKALTKLTKYVVVRCSGKTLRVQVTVKEGAADTDSSIDSSVDQTEDKEGGIGEDVLLYVAIGGGAAAVVVLVIVCAALCKRKKKNNQKRVGETLPEVKAKTCGQVIDVLPDANEVVGLASAENADESKAQAEALAKTVKELRSQVNGSDDQNVEKPAITDEQARKLRAVEKALRIVKQSFGESIKPVALRVAEKSTHRTEYFVGETFDMKGLALELIYSDGSMEIVRGSRLKLDTERAFTKFDNYVLVQCGLKMVRIPVTVKDIPTNN